MNIVILGGGISGLSAAWVAKKKYPAAKITLLEKTNRLGGAIQTVYEEGFLFERGPRTFQIEKCPYLLRLIQEVGIENDLIFSDKNATARYLWESEKLRSMSSFMPVLLFALFKEAFIPSLTQEDESIYEFATRRFSPYIAETFFDPMTLGIYSGDIRKLSIRSCFPQFFRWEREKGSCFRGVMTSFFKKKHKGLFSLRRGMGSLIEQLAKKINCNVVLSAEVQTIESSRVKASNHYFEADLIISALPGSVLSSLTHIPFVLKEASLHVTTLCYKENILRQKGYGYLVPSKEKENLLGVIWDSSIFPELNGVDRTCMTAMTRKGDIENIKKTVSRHLSIYSQPTHISSYTAHEAIPQFEVGYFNHLFDFKQQIKKKFPNLILLGNYLKNPSVESCINNSFELIVN